MSLKVSASAIWLLASLVSGNVAPRSATISFQDNIIAEAGGMHNIHIQYNVPLSGELAIHYGDCGAVTADDCDHALGSTHVGSHPLAARHISHPAQRPARFVWLPSLETTSGGCLHAFSGNTLVGRSSPVTISSRKQKRWTAAADVMDAEGPWFDGVEYLQEKEPTEVFVAATKSRTIGILGGGMSGLMTAHILDSVGFHNYTILEASTRIGGRVHTSYLNNTRSDEYQYQEMGPMRFPVSITYDDPAETLEIQDHRLVFQLADSLNDQNNHDPAYKVNFIPWIQSSSNNPRASPATNASYSNATEIALASTAYEDWLDLDREKFRSIASNVFRAHKWAVDNGYFHFSEAGYLNYALGIDANITDQVDDISDSSPSWSYDSVYFSATEWRTIDQGLSRLPAAFGPQVLNRTILNATVDSLDWDPTAKKMTIHYRNTTAKSIPFPALSDLTVDNTIVAIPFPKLRLARLPPFTSLLSRAIDRLGYEPSCKVALHYSSRFWEHLPEPIIGGCGSTDIPAIGSVCYPSYAINSTGPGVLLGSYISGDLARSVGTLTADEHAAYVQRAMVKIHGPAAEEEYTGIYDRICWEQVEFQGGAWASPKVGQQDLYLPSYFRTEMGTVVIGEHTSYTHAWIFSALESAVRGTTQLMLDLGLVDEAKAITEKWMARWMSM
ncbi:unnamed protein product [Zymoseptoria tritici ST99CH_3D7]|uniref:Amine oxidase domain-containing protein n=1 Tax=Zymoseptoria tritici (strain ST99CH_3D7) TaxID=1276538 RepID=A0A1X7RPV6_ZYMT9|nr:unnamed protein product [Zymoseptoria tritici ST99CH_3D7]